MNKSAKFEYEYLNEDEPVPTAYDVAEYQLATVFYDFNVHLETSNSQNFEILWG